jgi:N-acetylglucosamine transport system permease protein
LNNIFILSLVYASTALPFTIYLLSGFFVTLPKDYEEAAFVDGSGYFRTMLTIMMPMARPSIVTVILFNFLSFWNEYIISLTLLTKMDKTLPVGLMQLMQAQQAAANYGQLYAGLVLVMLPTLILYILVQRKLTQGMTLGGLKG